jgi:hypothetical protein
MHRGAGSAAVAGEGVTLESRVGDAVNALSEDARTDVVVAGLAVIEVYAVRHRREPSPWELLSGVSAMPIDELHAIYARTREN